MCFSMFQIPQSRFYAFGSILWENFQRKSSNNVYASRVLASYVHKPGNIHEKRWIGRPRTPNSEGSHGSTVTSATPSLTPRISGELVESTTLNTAKVVNAEFQRVHLPNDLHVHCSESKNLASRVTYLVVDIETTGLSRLKDRIIEIAIKDLQGGWNSTFQTLINPDCHVPNSQVHHITTCMVNRPEVPRMRDLIPILIKFVNSRKKPGGLVVIISHNGLVFDVPFLQNEFRRCSYEVPSDWLFLDTIPLCREAMRFGKGGSKAPCKVSLRALCEHYKIPQAGQAHRAMTDVNSLAHVFQRVTFDLKLRTSTIIDRCFKASDLK